MQIKVVKVLTNRGYAIRKDKFDCAELARLKRQLTVQAISHPDFPSPQPFGAYNESKSYFRIPTAFGIECYGQPDANLLKTFPVNIEFTGTLRDYQVEPVQTTIDHLNKHGRGLLCLVTGGGKSICALAVACALKQRTLIIVHKRSLLEQWRDEINKVVPTARIGIIRQKTMEIGDDYDINIAMWQTLLNRDGIPPTWGCVIIDECHRVCSKEFSQIMFKVNAQFVLGLSATPERADGTTQVLHWHLGNVIYRQPPVKRSNLKTLVWLCQYFEPAYDGIQVGGRHYTRAISHICNSHQRNSYVVQTVHSVFEREDAAERRVLILTARVAHAKTLVDQLGSLNKSVGLFTGGVAIDDLVEAKTRDIIVATYKIFEEGESVEDLNTIVFATPKRSITQALGRIFRKRHTVPPIVIDIADSLLPGQMRERIKIYRQETKGHLSYTYYDEHFVPKPSKSKQTSDEPTVRDFETIEADPM